MSPVRTQNSWESTTTARTGNARGNVARDLLGQREGLLAGSHGAGDAQASAHIQSLGQQLDADDADGVLQGTAADAGGCGKHNAAMARAGNVVSARRADFRASAANNVHRSPDTLTVRSEPLVGGFGEMETPSLDRRASELAAIGGVQLNERRTRSKQQPHPTSPHAPATYRSS